MFAGSFDVPARPTCSCSRRSPSPSLLQVLLATFTMLALSSLSKSSRYVGILYAGIIFFTAAIYGALYAITGSSSLSWLSLGASLSQVVDVDLPAARRATRRPWQVSLLVIVGLIVAVDLGARAARARRRGGDVSRRTDRHRRARVEVVRPGHRPERRHASTCRPASPACSGPNGAGKSTFMKLITGQLKPSKGVGHGARRADLGQPAPLFPDRLLPRAGRVLRADDRPRVGDGARAPERPQREGGRRGGAPRARPRST